MDPEHVGHAITFLHAVGLVVRVPTLEEGRDLCWHRSRGKKRKRGGYRPHWRLLVQDVDAGWEEPDVADLLVLPDLVQEAARQADREARRIRKVTAAVREFAATLLTAERPCATFVVRKENTP